MAEKVISTVFRISVALFLLGGLVIVILQGVGLVLGDGDFVTGSEEALAPWAYGSAGVAGLLAFALSYFHRADAETPTDADTVVTPEHA